MSPVSSPMAYESRELLKLLLDGEWHPLDKVTEKLHAMVPPGRAIRTYEVKAAGWERQNGPRVREELHMDKKIESGRKTLVGNALRSMSKRFVEVNGNGFLNEKWIRIRPEMLDTVRNSRSVPTRASPKDTENVDRTDEPAEKNTDEPAANGPLTIEEDRIRAIVADEVGRALDLFQEDLAEYLDRQFGILETRLQRRRQPRHRTNQH